MALASKPPTQRPIVPLPADARDEIVVHDVLQTDERLWVPQGNGVSFLPLCLGATQGYYVNLLRVRRSGVLSCHRHSGAVHAQVLRGRWYYLEHDWVAETGSFVMEAPGETHTLVVPPDVPEMITWFHVAGGYTYFDADGRVTGIEDVFTKIAKARAHYAAQGLPMAQLERLIR
ncbi:MAG: 2,4'-dihydroxyacetophenone dioxygenase family protein [Piscinibacter sp.]